MRILLLLRGWGIIKRSRHSALLAWMSFVVTFALALGAGDSAAAEPAKEKPPATVVYALAFSPDGKLLAAAAGKPDEQGQLALWDLKTRKLRCSRDEPAGLSSVAFAPDGKTLAIGSWASTARLIDAASGEVLHTLDCGVKNVRGVAFLSDGKTLATGCSDGSIRLWDPATGDVTATLEGHTEEICWVAASRDGTTLASGSHDASARVWDLVKKEVKQVFSQGEQGLIVRHVAFSPDGRWLVTSRWDGVVRIRDTDSYQLRARIRVGGGVECAQLAPDGRTLAACTRNLFVRLFDLDLGDPDPRVRERVDRLIVKLDDDDYGVREAAGRELLRVGMVAEPQLRKALDSRSAEVRIRARRLRDRIRSPKPAATLKGHLGDVQYLCFSPDGKQLASGDRSGVVKLWDVAGRKEIATLTLPAGGESSE